MEEALQHGRLDPACDCGACCDRCGDHTSACMSGKGRQMSISEEVAQEDGFMR